MTVLPTGEWYPPHEIELPVEDWGPTPWLHEQRRVTQTNIPNAALPDEPSRAAKMAELVEDMELLDFGGLMLSDGSTFGAPYGTIDASLNLSGVSWDGEAGRAQGTRAWTTLGKTPLDFVLVEDLPGYEPELFLEFESDDVLITGIEGIARMVDDNYQIGGTTHYGLFGTVRLTSPEVTWSPDLTTITADPTSTLDAVIIRPVVGYDPPGGRIVRPVAENTIEVIDDFPWMEFVDESQRTLSVGQYVESYEIPVGTSRYFAVSSMDLAPSSMTLELPSYRWVGLEIEGDAEEVRRAFT